MVKKSECRERAKLLLAHYIEGATGELCDRKEVGSIVDLIADAVHEELDERLDRLEKAVGGLTAANWQAQPCTPIKPLGDKLPKELAEFTKLLNGPEANEFARAIQKRAIRGWQVWGANLDGTYQGIVAAKTKKDAAAALGMTRYAFDQQGTVTANAFQVELAMREPGVAWRTKYSDHQNKEWERMEAQSDRR